MVLAEDTRHQSLIRRYLYRLGFTIRQIRFRDLPAGRGCGEQWVRERYAQEVAALRWRTSKAATALIVAIDADTVDLPKRSRQLSEALVQAGLPPREAAEQIAHLIAKRNVETWILCLSGESVNESEDYKKQPRIELLIGVAAETLFEWTRHNARVPSHCIPSLQVSIPEIQRILQSPR